MPAQMSLTHQQLTTLADQGWDCVLIEKPAPLGEVQCVEAWVIDPQSVAANETRSIIVDSEGVILSELVEKD